MSAQSLQNIYYFCIPENRPTGGIKYLLRHSHLINGMTKYGVASGIHVLYHPDFEPAWEQPFTIKRENRFNILTDLVVLPEILVEDVAPNLQKSRLRYTILAQNGFYILRGNADMDRLGALYRGAVSIVSTSEEITATIRGVFRDFRVPIFNVNYAFDRNVFSQHGPKRNIITYMPRKLPDHSRLLRRFLSGRNLRDWTIHPIDGLGEAGVVDLLSSSRIFLSFSEVEGFGLPPVEAALLGNKVIGYTGIGGREYFEPPLFEHIEHGDLLGYSIAIEREVARQTDNAASVEAEFAGPIAQLADRYSPERERRALEAFVEHAIESFGRK